MIPDGRACPPRPDHPVRLRRHAARGKTLDQLSSEHQSALANAGQGVSDKSESKMGSPEKVE